MEKWFYPLGGGYLPGDLSPYKNLKRLGPNTLIRYSNKFDMERFYPTKPHPELSNDKYEKTLNRIAELMNKNIELCTKKWNTPAISITGGMDSKTTLSCANGLYDKYKCYTFHSKPQEEEDAKVAEKICNKIGIKHKIYPIASKNEDVEHYEILKQIIYHNASYIGKPKDNEVRKFIYLNKLNEFDVELKSWVSEIGRAMQGRKLGLDLPKTLTPRHFTIFNTRYFATPKLLRYSDTQYKDYLKRIALDKPLYNYLHGDSFQWEFRDGSWASNATTTQDIFSHTVTMPMNNRKLIDMFLWFPYEYRKQDKVHKGVIKASNEEIAKLDVGVKNKSSRTKRLFIEKTYYYYRTLFYKNNN